MKRQQALEIYQQKLKDSYRFGNHVMIDRYLTIINRLKATTDDEYDQEQILAKSRKYLLRSSPEYNRSSSLYYRFGKLKYRVKTS